MSRRPRITGGRLKGRPLPFAIPASARPTSSRVREAMFSIVGHQQDGQRILDAYGGSGLLGIEAWSRGATLVVVEQNRKAATAIKRNLAELGATGLLHVGDIRKLAPTLGEFDGVLVDPPYKLAPVEALACLAPLVRGWLLLETDARTVVPKTAGPLALQRSRMYGGTAVHLYRPAGYGNGRNEAVPDV